MRLHQGRLYFQAVSSFVGNGPGRRNDYGHPGATFYEPTLLANVTQDMRIAQEETFGPVMCLIKWSNTEELLEQVNCKPSAHISDCLWTGKHCVHQ